MRYGNRRLPAAALAWSAIAAILVVLGACAAPSDSAAGAVVISDDPDEWRGSERLRLVVVGEAPTDPAVASPVDPADMAVLDLLYDGVTRWDDEAGEWLPEVAVSVESDPGVQVWTFVVGERRFSDGTPIGAEDVVASIERLRARSGFVSERLDHVTSVRALDGRTVQMRLARPDATLPALLSHPMFGITPRVGPAADLDGTVGSGPMHVAEDRPTALVAAGAARGVPGEVEVVVADDVETGISLVRSGRADVIHVPPSYGGAVDVSTASGVSVGYGLHAVAPELASSEARRSLVDLIDTERVAAALPGIEPTRPAGDGRLREQPSADLPESLSLAYVGAGPDGDEQPPNHAGGEVPLEQSEVDAEAAMAAALASPWRDAGVDVRVERLPLGDFVSMVSAGAHDVVRTGWIDLYPGDRPHWRLVDATSAANITGVGDPDLAALLREAAGSDDPVTVQAVETAIAELGVLVRIGRLQNRLVTVPGSEGIGVRADGSLVFGD